jgi:serine/threonine protein kinase
MPLPLRSTLGPYEVESAIGAGGMGEVYKAVDRRLHRSVAIKVLPAELVGNLSRRQRFEREARTISHLSHPHICTLFDVGENDGSPFLVMEYLDGETLAARLQRGPVPSKDALRIGIEIADALDHAHRQRIVHRDLKPGNVMLTRTGAKLLDFGLARLADVDFMVQTGATLVGRVETLTEEGTIVGTVQYMAPEQLEARDTDARTDIFAFGSVMYEMLTGRPAFTGATKASVMAAILERDPPAMSAPRDASSVAAAPSEISPLLEGIVLRCLEKAPADRWQTAADLRAALRLAADDSRPYSRMRARSSRRRAAWIAGFAGVALVALAWAGRGLVRSDDAPPPYFVFTVNPPPNSTFTETGVAFAESPDGMYLAFIASAPDGNSAIWLRSRENPTPEQLRGTDSGAAQLFWSADSRSLAFFSLAPLTLKKVDISSKFVQVLVQSSGQAGSWNRDGVVLFARPEATGLIYRVPSSGGQPQPVTRLDPARAETSHEFPQFLPDGRHFIYFARSKKPEFDFVLYAASLDDPSPVRLMAGTSNAMYSPPGYLVFMRGTALVAQRFDSKALRLDGEPTVIDDPVERNTLSGKGVFSLSSNGVIAYRSPQVTELAWYAPDGRRLSTYGAGVLYRNPVMSRDGSRVAVEISGRDGTMDVWTLDRSGVPTRFSFDHPRMPLWSPDGRAIALSTADGIAIRAVDSGRDDVIVRNVSQSSRPVAWTADGAWLIYEEWRPGTRRAIFIVPAAGGPSRALVQTPLSDDTEAQISPDQHWLAYVSNESGQNEVYVRRFPSGGVNEKWMVSQAGGIEPHWSHGTLLYLASDRALMSVPYTSGVTFTPGEPVRLFQTRMSTLRVPAFTRNQYLVAADGRILINQPPEAAPPPAVKVIVNWPSRLKNPH